MKILRLKTCGRGLEGVSFVAGRQRVVQHMRDAKVSTARKRRRSYLECVEHGVKRVGPRNHVAGNTNRVPRATRQRRTARAQATPTTVPTYVRDSHSCVGGDHLAQRHGDLAQLPELRQHRRDEHLIRRARPQLLDEGASRAEHVRGGVEAIPIARRMVADVSAADLRPSSQTLGSEAPKQWRGQCGWRSAVCVCSV